MGTGGKTIHFLQEHHIRLLAFQFIDNSLHVFLHPLCRSGSHLTSAVHKEIRIVSQSAVADVPAHHLDAGSRLQGIKGILCQTVDFYLLRAFRPIFHCRQHDEQHQQQNHQRDEEGAH